MEYTRLGNTDMEISRACVGCMSFGKAIVPFCTSASSGIGSSASDLEKLAGGTWLDGHRFSGSDTRETILNWAEGLGILG